MAFNGSTLQFKPGDPLPATKHNSLVASSVEMSEAFAAEHRSDGVHVGLRFEAECVYAERSSVGVGWERSDIFTGFAVFSIPGEPDQFRVDVLGELADVPDGELGIVAQDDQGGCPAVAREPGWLRVIVDTPGASTVRLYFFANRPRRAA